MLANESTDLGMIEVQMPSSSFFVYHLYYGCLTFLQVVLLCLNCAFLGFKINLVRCKQSSIEFLWFLFLLFLSSLSVLQILPMILLVYLIRFFVSNQKKGYKIYRL